MNGEVSGRTLRSRSKDITVAKTNKKVAPTKKSVSYEESVIIKTSGKSSSFVSSSFDENGLTNKESKETANKSIRETSTGNNSMNVFDSGGINTTMEPVDSGGGYSSDDSINDSPWQSGQFKSPEEVLSYYKRFGDWWNYFPKTDYAYNRTSKWYGKEVATGIPVIPNMARPALHPENLLKHLKTSESSRRNLTRESMIFEKSNGAASFSSSNSMIKNFFYKIITVITTVMTTIWTSIRSVTSIVTFSSNKNSVKGSARLLRDDVIERDSFWNKIFRWLYRFSSWLLIKEVVIFWSIHELFSKDRSRKKSRILKFLLLLLIPLIIAILGYSRLSGSDYNQVENYLFSFDYSKYFYSVVDYFRLVTDYVADTWWYLYAFLPAFSQFSFPRYSSNPTVVTSPHGNIDSEQLNGMVEQMVREALKKDSAILLEDIVSHPRFKDLVGKAVTDKTASWDPSSLLASEQWKITIKQVVEEHYSQKFNQDDIEGRIVRNVEERFDSKFSELQEASNRLEEKFLALEKDMLFLIQQYVTHQQLEDTIKNLTKHLYADAKLDEKVLIEKVKSEVTVKIQEDVNALFKTLLENKHQVEDIKGDIDLDQVKEYVRVMIERAIALYDADKIGIVDYALESSGGIVVSTRCTESYSGGQATYKFFGIALWKRSNSPRTVIQPGVHPGECWAFAGHQGYIVIELSATIIVTAFTLEHIPRSLAPQERIDSAPKDFSVWGLKYETDKDRTFLGRFRFMENGTSLQKFEATAQEEPFRLVELIIESNHGNLEYTCLYRFRVHGVPVS